MCEESVVDRERKRGLAEHHAPAQVGDVILFDGDVHHQGMDHSTEDGTEPLIGMHSYLDGKTGPKRVRDLHSKYSFYFSPRKCGFEQ